MMSISQAYQARAQITPMRADPAGRAGVSRRGSNSEMRACARRSEQLSEEGERRFCGEEEGKRQGVRGGEGNEEQGEVKKIRVREKFRPQTCLRYHRTQLQSSNRQSFAQLCGPEVIFSLGRMHHGSKYLSL